MELDTTNCGIICVTPDNMREPWLHFEAGALSKSVKQAQVHPFLLKDMLGRDIVLPITSIDRYKHIPHNRDCEVLIPVARRVGGSTGTQT